MKPERGEEMEAEGKMIMDVERREYVTRNWLEVTNLDIVRLED